MFNKREYIAAVYHVYTVDKESRKDLVEFLELQGYVCEEDNVTNRDKVLNTRLPVVVNVIDRKYSILHNVVCAAASIASNMLISEEEFYVLYKVHIAERNSRECGAERSRSGISCKFRTDGKQFPLTAVSSFRTKR